MPEYDYKCEACGKNFAVHQSYEEHDNSRVKCPNCGSLKTKRILAAVFTKTSKKS